MVDVEPVRMLHSTTNGHRGVGEAIGGQYEPKHEIYWRETEHVAPGAPLSEDVTCDLAIIGGGYTAMWTAFFLKQADPSMDIHILEADYAGVGASGHNDGFVTPTIGHSMAALVHRFGAEQAKLAYTVVGKSMLELDRFCKKYSVNAEFERTGYYQVATNPAQRRLLEHDIELTERLGAQSAIELLDAVEARARIGSPAITAAFKVGGALINPHRLARGLHRVVTELGVHVHESTRVVDVERTAQGHVAKTPHARVTAPNLLYATNAYQHQFAPFRRKVVPVWSYAAVTEPLTDRQLAQVHWPEREGFVEAGNFIVFGRLTAENRLLFGGGRANYEFGRNMDEQRYIDNPKATATLRGVLNRYFPQWRDVRFSHTYGGCVAITREIVPHVGTLGDGRFYAHGYCGNGIAVTHSVGKVLRDLILRRDTTYTKLLFVNGKELPFPPEPLSYIGAKGLTSLLAAQDRFPGLIRRQLI
ncbi:FAD-binding oxidoreductase [Nocardia sp. CDC159]|uniref:FAD-binding oxidoreductase n=1 Tax=Nocardia pulmonis TaxID=2951408 RepID=A0A9X2J1M2_9NOCA|nr:MULTISPECIES: FAD-dependent oxidoreductase [Nocardia]MCM6779019.1 FAD-binding oxidoreductase [Nocardia pulmonis]MCM6791909.1 FAD-binding oxidoreductase [Nocardia sp. CDC159]